MRYFEMPARGVADDTQNASVNFTNHGAQGETKHTGPGIWAGSSCALGVYALAAAGQRGVSHLLELFASDMRVTMTLIGAKAVHEIARDSLDLAEKELAAEAKARSPVRDTLPAAE
jgi:hypothetical protein